jgi:hypothetical protein
LPSGCRTETESMIDLKKAVSKAFEKTVGCWNWHCRLDEGQIIQSISGPGLTPVFM